MEKISPPYRDVRVPYSNRVKRTTVKGGGGQGVHFKYHGLLCEVNNKVMKLAKPEAIFMHCLPASRGEEVADDVIDGKQSVVWLEALNRIHVQKSIIEWCLK